MICKNCKIDYNPYTGAGYCCSVKCARLFITNGDMNEIMKMEGFFKNAFRIDEVFNTKADISWENDGKRDVGTFILLDDTYRILIEAGTFKEFEFLNIAFEIFKKDANKFTTDVTLDNKHASKVLGAVRNGIIDRINVYEFDAVIFFANDSHDKRMRIYNRMASEYMKTFGYIKDDYKLPNGRVVTVVMKKDFAKQINDDELDSIITGK